MGISAPKNENITQKNLSGSPAIIMYDEAPIFTLKKVMGREKFHDPENINSWSSIKRNGET